MVGERPSLFSDVGDDIIINYLRDLSFYTHEKV